MVHVYVDEVRRIACEQEEGESIRRFCLRSQPEDEFWEQAIEKVEYGVKVIDTLFVDLGALR